MDKNIFEISQPDFQRSPLTGMTRQHWQQAGRYLLEHFLQAIDPADPQPPTLSPVMYPAADDPPSRFIHARFEAVTRSLLLAAPLLAEEPDLQLAGLPLAATYRRWLARVSDPSDSWYVGHLFNDGSSSQSVVEGAAIAICLWLLGDDFWQGCDESLRQQLLALFEHLGHGPTHAQNWRFFNVLMLSFRHGAGAAIDESVLLHHLDALAAYDVGDGWYRDGVRFDYYSVWAFQAYAPLWIHYYGQHYQPQRAAAFAARNRLAMASYPRFFDRDGRSLMWGRSSTYRCAASAALSAAFLLPDASHDPGWARRICSGNLLQFLQHPDFLIGGLPAPGFYGRFDAILQKYSCASSPLWLAKTFACLALPETHPFWTATENEGDWPQQEPCRLTVLGGPGLVLINRAGDGSTELISGKIRQKHEAKGDHNYLRLAYHSRFPWQQITASGVCSMGLSFRMPRLQLDWQLPLERSWAGVRDGVIYLQHQTPGYGNLVDQAVVPLADGLICVFRLRLNEDSALQVGSHALPHLGQEPRQRSLRLDGWEGLELVGTDRSVALLAPIGHAIERVDGDDLHPEGGRSSVLAWQLPTPRHRSQPLQVLVLRHRAKGQGWSDAEHTVIAECRIEALGASGSPGVARLQLADGRRVEIDFAGIEGRLSQ